MAQKEVNSVRGESHLGECVLIQVFVTVCALCVLTCIAIKINECEIHKRVILNLKA